ncbi:hypothetical protein PPBDW_II0496 [Photobacterium kishitanii]|nr:hypothetical protein PPBDW_II0496 [Photobacterium kishitanii]
MHLIFISNVKVGYKLLFTKKPPTLKIGGFVIQSQFSMTDVSKNKRYSIPIIVD